MAEIAFTIPGPPVPWARARVSHEDGWTQMFTPKEMRGYKEAVGWTAKTVQRGRAPFDGPVEMHLVFYLPVPRTWPLRRQDAALDGKLLPAVRPDLDNYVKAIADGLNRIVYKDDCQIVRLEAEKRYGNPPQVWVRIVERKTA